MRFFENASAIVTSIFLLIVLSYYALLFIRTKRSARKNIFKSITVIVPCHNEEENIRDTLDSILKAKFPGKKEVIVVDDGSRDSTAKIASGYKVRLIKKAHTGKSDSINHALKVAKGQIIAIVDGDSIIMEDALEEMSLELSRPNTAACTGVIKVRNRNRFICMWVHIEQVYNSLLRYLFAKVNANIVTPGPLSIYRAECLREIDGFGTDGLAEDIDVTIRLIRKGYHVRFAEKAVSETNMPYKAREFLRQRVRFAKGIARILRKHLQLNSALIDLYTIPLLFFSYVQALIIGSFTLYQVITGYVAYFASKGIFFDLNVLRFFIEWFSIVGIVRWVISVFSGQTPLSMVTAIGLASTFLSYPLFIYAIIKFDKKIDLRHIVPLILMSPFWLMIMMIYIVCIPSYFMKQKNIWKKNE